MILTIVTETPGYLIHSSARLPLNLQQSNFKGVTGLTASQEFLVKQRVAVM